MTSEELPPYLMPVVAPIYRTVNDEQNKAAGFGKSNKINVMFE
jgi:U3 small nucleolar RNA-associated protein 20